MRLCRHACHPRCGGQEGVFQFIDGPVTHRGTVGNKQTRPGRTHARVGAWRRDSSCECGTRGRPSQPLGRCASRAMSAASRRAQQPHHAVPRSPRVTALPICVTHAHKYDMFERMAGPASRTAAVVPDLGPRASARQSPQSRAELGHPDNHFNSQSPHAKRRLVQLCNPCAGAPLLQRMWVRGPTQ